jgi:non-reducing end alpha-L-arabinofuranosidase
VPCLGSDPWIQADLENGLFQSYEGAEPFPFDTSLHSRFVTAMLSNDGQDRFALAGGDASEGVLTTTYAGVLPDNLGSDYSPMHQEGGIGLGVGGDNSRAGSGEFFEGG